MYFKKIALLSFSVLFFGGFPVYAEELRVSSSDQHSVQRIVGIADWTALPDSYIGNYAVEAWTHHTWASPPPARWMWATYRTQETENPRFYLFRTNFSLPSNIGVTKATLRVTSDDSHHFWINDSRITSIVNSYGHRQWIQTYSIPTSFFRSGINRIVIAGSNAALPGSNSATNPAGITYDIVVEYERLPNLVFSADPANLPFGGGSTMLSWTSQNANFCSANGGDWTGVKGNASGIAYTERKDVTLNSFYALMCRNNVGSIEKTASVVVGSTPINGSCGTAAKPYTSTQTAYTGTFCSSAGTASPASPVFPATGATTSWQCPGQNGGTPALCSATREIPALTLKDTNCSSGQVIPSSLDIETSRTIVVCDGTTPVEPGSWNITPNQTAFYISGSDTDTSREFTARGNDGEAIKIRATGTGYTPSEEVTLIVDKPIFKPPTPTTEREQWKEVAP